MKYEIFLEKENTLKHIWLADSDNAVDEVYSVLERFTNSKEYILRTYHHTDCTIFDWGHTKYRIVVKPALEVM